MDLTHTKNYNALRGRDINLIFDPVTGYNVDPIGPGQQVQNRPDPRFTSVTWVESAGGSEQLYLDTIAPSLQIQSRGHDCLHADVH